MGQLQLQSTKPHLLICWWLTRVMHCAYIYLSISSIRCGTEGKTRTNLSHSGLHWGDCPL